MKGMDQPFPTSEEQQAICNAMMESAKFKSIIMMAFNNSIYEEFAKRVPDGVEATNTHKFGSRVVRNAYGSIAVNKFRVRDIIARHYNTSSKRLMRKWPTEIKAMENLAGLCKVNLLNGTREELEHLTSAYHVDTGDFQDRVYRMVPAILEECMKVGEHREMDFNDMLWLPIVLGLPIPKYDLCLADEAQDFNKAQHQLTLNAGHRLMYVGDERQAIYSFCGADCRSLHNLEATLSRQEQGVITLPLTVTRRCGKAIVREANKYVEDFHTHPDNPEGKIGHLKMEDTPCTECDGTGNCPYPELSEEYDYCPVCLGKGTIEFHHFVKEGDMVLCRCNAPLVQQCFRFLKRGIKANINGRDVARGLISTVDRMKATTMAQFHENLEAWHHAERVKETQKRNPCEAKLEAIDDRVVCIQMFAEGKKTIDEIKQSIDQIFSNSDVEGVLFSSIHRAKGLESDRVFLMMPEKEAPIPHPMAKSADAKEQEMNLLYIAITRAKNEFYYVT